MGGTHLPLLLEQRQRALDALNAGIGKIEAMEPHPRDYTLCPPGFYERAVAQHSERWSTLVRIKDSVQHELETLMDYWDPERHR